MLGLPSIPDHGTVSALDAFPSKDALIVEGSFSVTEVDPLTEVASPVLVPSASEIEMFLAVPQVAVVIAEVPLKLVPLMFLAVASFVAVDAFPSTAPINLVA